MRGLECWLGLCGVFRRKTPKRAFKGGLFGLWYLGIIERGNTVLKTCFPIVPNDYREIADMLNIHSAKAKIRRKIHEITIRINLLDPLIDLEKQEKLRSEQRGLEYALNAIEESIPKEIAVESV